MGRRIHAAWRVRLDVSLRKPVMRSIRLSLIVYFLLLFVVAMGAVSIFVYQTTAQTLLSKQASTDALIQAQYRDQCRELKAGLDSRLAYRARTLARRARFRDHLE